MCFVVFSFLVTVLLCSRVLELSGIYCVQSVSFDGVVSVSFGKEKERKTFIYFLLSIIFTVYKCELVFSCIQRVLSGIVILVRLNVI